jgi:hypothetical protein
MTHKPADTSKWPEYISHKIVRAAPIWEIIDAGGELAILVKPYGDHTVERFYPTVLSMVRHAEVGWYAVVYSDGFRSISPKEAFDAGYDEFEGQIK